MSKKKKRTQKEPAPDLNKPWLARQSALIILLALSLSFGAFIVWQLQPSEGWGSALLWGLGFAVSIWAIFGISFAFNSWVRGQ